MDELERHELVKKYARLKKRKNEIDSELERLRKRIIDYCEQEQLTEFESGRYQVRLVRQERREYDDQKLYDALPDPDVWRLISRADSAKIAGMLKLNVLTPEILKDTFTLKTVTLLHVDKK